MATRHLLLTRCIELTATAAGGVAYCTLAREATKFYNPRVHTPLVFRSARVPFSRCPTEARRAAPGAVRLPGVELPGPDTAEQRVVQHLDRVLREENVRPDRGSAQGTLNLTPKHDALRTPIPLDRPRSRRCVAEICVIAVCARRCVARQRLHVLAQLTSSPSCAAVCLLFRSTSYSMYDCSRQVLRRRAVMNYP